VNGVVYHAATNWCVERTLSRGTAPMTKDGVEGIGGQISEWCGVPRTLTPNTSYTHAHMKHFIEGRLVNGVVYPAHSYQTLRTKHCTEGRLVHGVVCHAHSYQTLRIHTRI